MIDLKQVKNCINAISKCKLSPDFAIDMEHIYVSDIYVNEFKIIYDFINEIEKIIRGETNDK